MNPFSVPEDYFEAFEETVLNRLAEQKLKDHISDTGFAVPKGYFEAFEETMKTRVFEQKLKSEITDSGFSVPEEYFANIQTSIQTTITESRLRQSVSTDGHNVPEGYFENLSERNLAMVGMEQFASSQENSFAVPTNYFENLSSKILDRIADENKKSDGNIVKIPAKKSWSQYAAAAAILLMVSIGSYWALHSSSQPQTDADIRLALHDISNEDLTGYLTQMSDGVELIELASFLQDGNTDKPFDINERVEVQEIEEYLNYML
jgi:hypothetical protein